MATEKNSVIGLVTERLPNAEFKVQFPTMDVRCHLSGKMRLNKINVFIGDRVAVVIPENSVIGRIIRRI